MDTTTIIIAVVVAVVVIAAVIAFAVFSSRRPARRTAQLKKRFGPEYDHAVEVHGDKGAAERDLSERLRRHDNLRLRELTSREREAHSVAWSSVQQEFVDDPVRAIRNARRVVESAMADLGYPEVRTTGDPDQAFEQRVRELSVEHPRAVARYRRAQAARPAADPSGTEHMREELVAYRGLVDALVGGLPKVGATTSDPARRSSPGNGTEEAR
ncbi:MULTISPECIES: hypothetical protein [unclassified Nocardiopsis]|uniref:hypothetical protein n=1 Tax=unclassified Nocardiopsis TaxID=2649073 RepID=UPI001915881A|nr:MULTISPECIES: hypothetical protein [unclassified Nocardiopsis]